MRPMSASAGPPFAYALPVRPQDGRPVASTKDWDEYDLWTHVFSACGVWQQTELRQVAEYGLEFRQSEQNGRVLRRMDEPTRSLFHNKALLFKRLVAAHTACAPPTCFSVAELKAAMAADAAAAGTGPSSSGPPTIWFYKKAKDSRGRGVYPFSSLDQLPEEELAAMAQEPHLPASAVPATGPVESGGRLVAGPAAPGAWGVFQRQVPNMLLWAGTRKFDMRVLVVMGPGSTVWLHRTSFMRLADRDFRADDLSRTMQCTNLSQGAEVLLAHEVMGPTVYGQVLAGLKGAVYQVATAMREHLPVRPAPGQGSVGCVHYFGFDFMLDKELSPWLLEVNSTPGMVFCNRTGAVSGMLKDWLELIVQPELGGKHVQGDVGGWLQAYP